MFFPPSCFQSLLLAAVFVEVLVSSSVLPPPTPPLTMPTLLSSTLITQLLLGNTVPARPSISHVATATECTHTDTVNMLFFSRSQRYMHDKKPTCVFSSDLMRRHPSTEERPINQQGNDCHYNLMHLQHLYICVHGKKIEKNRSVIVHHDSIDC